MTDSSAQPIYTITLNDDTLDLNTASCNTMPSISSITDTSYGTITISNIGVTGSSYIGSGSTINVGSSSDTIFTSSFALPQEWKDSFPEWDRVQKMCEMYPGLKIAFDKFKLVYDIVKDDYDTPPEKRIKP